MRKLHSLAGIIGQRETAVIGAVVDEITAKPGEQLGLKLMPIKAYPQHLVYTEMVSGFGGLLKERVLGEEGVAGAASSSETFEFSPGAYQEAKRFGERDLIALRRLGSIGDRGATGLTSGVLDFMSRAGEDLKVKLNNRLNKMAWDTLLTGKYTYQGVTKFDFAVPTANTVTAGTDWSIASSATPMKDLLAILVGNAVYRKYIVKEFIINPVTAAAILNSAEVRNIVINNSMATGDLNKAKDILYPGLPPFRVCKDAWQDQSIVAGRVVQGNAQYFVPDFKVLAVADFGGSLYDGYGEIQMTYNINDPSASVESPAIGIYSFVDELGLQHRKSPWVDIVTGFNGGANLLRRNDVLVINGKSGI
jgi:hypothetical protein